MIRNAMFARVAACARDDLDALVRLEREGAQRVDPPRQVVMGRSVWDEGLERYFAEHDSLGTDGDARGPALLEVGPEESGVPVGADEDAIGRIRRVRQTLADPEGHHDWVIEAVADLDASDEVGELVLMASALRRL